MTQATPNTRLTYQQVEALLAPINPKRVLGLKKGSSTLSYVAQHDVRAHLTRIFGFGNWSMDVLSTDFIFEEQNPDTKRWVAGYRATVRISICSSDGFEIAHYTDSHASGNMPNPERAEAHALALTTAVSTAMKRAATCLGDQFGLSLYNKGQRTAFVIGTLVGSPATHTTETVAAEVKALGDETDQDIHAGLDEAKAAAVEAAREPTVIDTETGEVLETVGGTVLAAESTNDEGQNLAEEWLGRLRGLATEADASKRILAVAALKQQAVGTDLMERTTDVKGETVTYGRLADLVAGGAFL
jgi:hypothetical protein